ncbi:hypothetical protein [Bradyrhizobium canariense]|uniref:hypothetical protein n=1 Tax=Bradyrhizobium canariense TaxID=255045 RepID=UPI0011780B85|nr:hypothetical protein [Bradyrhizobium canariense]
MKSGLLVLVDFFSLLCITLFSVFVISQDNSSANPKAGDFHAYEISLVPTDPGALDAYFGHRPLLSELIALSPRLVSESGDEVLINPQTRGVNVFAGRDSMRIIIRPEVSFRKLAIDVGAIIHPIALTIPYRLRIQEQSPKPNNSRSWATLKIGEWDDVSISRN